MNTRDISHKEVRRYPNIIIVRSECRREDSCGNLYGPRMVWYDCCPVDESECSESFKTLKQAVKYCKEHEGIE